MFSRVRCFWRRRISTVNPCRFGMLFLPWEMHPEVLKIIENRCEIVRFILKALWKRNLSTLCTTWDRFWSPNRIRFGKNRCWFGWKFEDGWKKVERGSWNAFWTLLGGFQGAWPVPPGYSGSPGAPQKGDKSAYNRYKMVVGREGSLSKTPWAKARRITY